MYVCIIIIIIVGGTSKGSMGVTGVWGRIDIIHGQVTIGYSQITGETIWICAGVREYLFILLDGCCCCIAWGESDRTQRHNEVTDVCSFFDPLMHLFLLEFTPFMMIPATTLRKSNLINRVHPEQQQDFPPPFLHPIAC